MDSTIKSNCEDITEMCLAFFLNEEGGMYTRCGFSFSQQYGVFLVLWSFQYVF